MSFPFSFESGTPLLFTVCRASGNSLREGQLRFFLYLCEQLRDVHEELMEINSTSKSVAVVENIAVNAADKYSARNLMFCCRQQRKV